MSLVLCTQHRVTCGPPDRPFQPGGGCVVEVQRSVCRHHWSLEVAASHCDHDLACWAHWCSVLPVCPIGAEEGGCASVCEQAGRPWSHVGHRDLTATEPDIDKGPRVAHTVLLRIDGRRVSSVCVCVCVYVCVCVCVCTYLCMCVYCMCVCGHEPSQFTLLTDMACETGP